METETTTAVRMVDFLILSFFAGLACGAFASSLIMVGLWMMK